MPHRGCFRGVFFWAGGQGRKTGDSGLGGVGKEIGNTIDDMYNFGNRVACALSDHCKSPEQVKSQSPSSPEEEKVMWLTSLGMFFIDFEEMFPVKGSKAFEYVTHHGLPQQKKLQAIFRALGLDIEKYTIRMEKNRHRFIHTNRGGNWNRVWEKFLKDPKNHDAAKIVEQLNKMIRDFKLHEPL
jgi:hypothetical protein